jgi:ribulose 1,5-bisphosphate synthetase/thiazole synthase
MRFSVTALVVLLLNIVKLGDAKPASLRHATILERQDEIKDSYDYVIVGGGTAGLTVADRLTADGNREQMMAHLLFSRRAYWSGRHCSGH